MPTYQMRAPDGQMYKIDGPAGATDDQVRAEIIRQHPHLGAPAPTPSSPVDTNLVAQAKKFLMGPEPPRGRILPERAFWAMVPGSWPGLAAAGASFIPGAGPLAAGARTLAAGGAGGIIEGVRGGDPMKGALEAGGGTLVGEAGGALGRAGTRTILSKLDPITEKVAAAIAKAVPSFAGMTPKSTIVNAMGTAGQVALSREYRSAVEKAISDAGDPIIKLGEEIRPASDMWRLIKSEKRALRTQTGELPRVKESVNRLQNIHEVEDEFAKQLEKKLPPAQQGVFAEANRRYRAGKEVQRLFTPVGRPTTAKVQKMLTPEGKLDQPTLASNLLIRSGKLQEALPPDVYKQIEDAILRGAELGSRDVPGRLPHLGLHFGVFPKVYGLPHAPRPVGRPEQQSELVAQIMRRLGLRAAGSQMEP